LRKLVRLSHFFLIICLWLAIFSATSQPVAAAESPNITAPSAILVEVESGKILWEKNAHQRRANASTTKIATALLTLNRLPLTKVLKASKKSTLAGGSEIYLTPGETMTVENLLYALLLPSANDSAAVLAEAVSGSQKKFADEMNQLASQLGALNTHFANPHGLDQPNHYTSAYDLTLITREALKNSTFRKIVTTKERVIKRPSNNYPKTFRNHNKLLFKYSNIKGVKTGYTSKAGHCLVALADGGNIEVLAVVLGASTSEDCYADSMRLVNYGLSSFQKKTFVSSGDVVARVFLPQNNRYLDLVVEDNLTWIFPKDKSPTEEIYLASPLKLPIQKGERLGYYRLLQAGEIVKQVPILASETVEKPSFAQIAKVWYFKLREIFRSWLNY
jgi:D-alanyl-D-alanine carboxypeptidase (penicillin-binding protein 5/6)